MQKSQNDTLSYINIPGGRIVEAAGGLSQYEYNLTDHPETSSGQVLGNVRVSFKEQGDSAVIIQSLSRTCFGEDRYYPFGMRMSGQHFTNTDGFLSGVEGNKFLYNGKELQEQTNYYDYLPAGQAGGFRQMDPQLGRWHVEDALSEKYYSYSPYAYTMNDPINHIDVAGLMSEYYFNPPHHYQHWGRDSYDMIPRDNGINGLMGLYKAHHNNPRRDIGGKFEDYWTKVNGEWIHNSYLKDGGYFWDKETNTLQLYSKDLNKWAVINLENTGVSVTRNDDGTTNWSNLNDYFAKNDGSNWNNGLDFANGLATIAGLFGLAGNAIKWNDAGHIVTYAQRGKNGVVHSAEVVTRYNRIQAIGTAKWFKVAGKIAGYTSAAIYVSQAYYDFSEGGQENFMHGLGNLGYAGISVIMTAGIPGMLAGGLFYLVDETIGWREMGRRQNQVILNNSNWWHSYSH